MELSLALTSTDHHHQVNNNPSPSEAHPDTMDFLSREWCNFAVQSLQPDHTIYDRSIVPVETSIARFQGDLSLVPCGVSSNQRLFLFIPDYFFKLLWLVFLINEDCENRRWIRV